MKLKKILSIFICAVMIMCNTLSSFANNNDELETTEPAIVDQLKIDLGEEKVNEILNSSEIFNNEEKIFESEKLHDDIVEEEIEKEISKTCVDDSKEEFVEEPEEDVLEEKEKKSIDVCEENFKDEFIGESEDNTVDEACEDDELLTDGKMSNVELSNDLFELDENENIDELSEINERDEYVDELEVATEDILKDETISDENMIADGSCSIDDLNITESTDVIASMSEMDDEALSFKLMFETAPLFGIGSSYTFSCNWADGSGIDKQNVTKLTLQKGGSVPTGTEYDIINSNGLKGYVNGTEIIVFAPSDDDVIYAPDLSGTMFRTPVLLGEMALIEIVGLNNLDTSNVTSMNAMFSGCKHLESLDLSSFNTSNVNDMSIMFADCSSLTTLDLSSFDTSKVTDMGQMFKGCESLISLDLSNFNTENVEDQGFWDMFYKCTSLQNVNLSSFNTQKATGFRNMFYECSSLTQLDLSNFNTSSVKGDYITDTLYAVDFCAMFKGCSSLTSLNLSNFDTSNAKSFASMFQGCSSLEVLDISSFNTSEGTKMQYMFNQCTNLTTIYSSNLFNTSKYSTGESLFLNCPNLVGGNGTTYDSSHIDKEYARIDTDSTPGYFTNGDTSSNEYTLNANWYPTSGVNGITKGLVTKIKFLQSDTEPSGTSFVVGFNSDNTKNLNAYINGTEVTILIPNGATLYSPSDSTSLFSMYDGGTQFSSMTKSLTSIENLNLLNTSNVINMKSMFRFNSNLTSLDISSFDTSNVTNMSDMFGYCQSISSIDVSTFDTSNVTDMSRMFQEMRGLTAITLGSIDTSAVNKMRAMFQFCNSLTDIDLIEFNTSNVTDMWGMFDNDNVLTTIYVSTNFVTTSVIDSSQMFNNCSSIVGEAGTSYDSTKIDKTYARIDTAGTPGYFTEGNLGTLNSISVKTAPTKTNYIAGDNFDPTGLVLTLSYDSGKSKSLSYNTSTSSDFNFAPSLTTALVTSNTSVTITYGGFDCTQTITVKELSSITVNTPPTKVSYREGECFNPAGLVINLEYSDSSTDIVSYAGNESDFSFSPDVSTELTATDTNVTITYFEKTCTQPITIVTLDSISVLNAQTKSKYKAGEFYNPAGLKIRLTYTDLTTEEVTYTSENATDFTFTPNETTPLEMINTSVTIGYAGKSCTQAIEVIEVSSIAVKSAPTTVKYAEGSNFDPTGLKIELTYSDLTTKETIAYAGNEADFTFNPSLTEALNTIGNAIPISITYSGKTCTQNVQVVGLSSIEVNTAPTKVIYNVGENFDPTGLKIKLNYSDSTNQIINYETGNASNFTFTPNATAALSTANTSVTIEYAGKSCTQNITIKELSSITLKTNPTKLSYATGQSLNPNGLVITLNYTNYTISGSTPEAIDVTYNSSTQSKFSFNPSGTSISTGAVTVTYDGKTGASMQPTFNITVKQVATVSVASKPSKTSYYNGDTFNASGLKLRVEYTDSTNEIVTYSSNFASDYTFSPSGTLSTGMNTINVSYGGKTTTFPISVTVKPSYHGGGGGGGGGGAISGGKGINPFTQSSGTTNTQATAKISSPRILGTEKIANSATSEWVKNADGSWGLNSNGIAINNGFLIMTTMDATTALITNNTYHFDETGKMTVGWLKDTNGTFYFFEDAKTADEGKMCFGWKQMSTGVWYYFGTDGKMLAGQMTPDGYMLNADGSWVNTNVDSSIQTTHKNTNSEITESFGSSGRTESNIEMKGPAAK